MKIERIIVLPGSAEADRQQLASALASTIVVQKGNLVLSRITCSGYIEGSAVNLTYTEFGRGYPGYSILGFLTEDESGLRLHMTVSDGYSPVVYYVPFIVWVFYWVLTHFLTGTAPLSFGKLVIGSMATLFLRYIVSLIMSSYLTYGANRIEEIILKIVSRSIAEF